jgi:hypothetical protein
MNTYENMGAPPPPATEYQQQQHHHHHDRNPCTARIGPVYPVTAYDNLAVATD